MQAEREWLSRENGALKNELGAFDEKFFEELEDLKYLYDEAATTVKRAQQLLQQHDTAKATTLLDECVDKLKRNDDAKQAAKR